MAWKPGINKNWIVLGAALGVGLLAAFGANRYLAQQMAEIEERQKSESVRLVVAKDNMAKGAKLTGDNMAYRDVPKEWSPSGAITPEQFDRAENAVLAYSLRKGEPVQWAQLEGQKQPSFSARLAPGRRAVAVPVDEISSVSGMLEPGDLVDIIVSVKHQGRDMTFVMLPAVPVLATGPRATPQGETPDKRSFTTITLDTTPEDARRIIAARDIGKITAMLRAPGDRGAISLVRSDAAALLGLGTIGGISTVPVIYGGRGPIADVPRLNAPAAQIPAEAPPALAQPPAYPAPGTPAPQGEAR